ncbi:hypothetical protein [Streptomyces sp. NPDC017958]|uniref:hypothetical protein n=1 Tax=Streptomyces sp. NPDC017958 TaxID=3365021 RepID=UPI0037B1336E
MPGLTDLAHTGAVAYRPPALLLTGCDALPRLVPALGAGERDCVMNPVRIAEVLARIKVLLRADPSGAFGGGERRGGVLHYADLVLDDTEMAADRRGGGGWGEAVG